MSKTNVEKFKDFVKSECKAHGIKLELRKRSYLVLSGNIKCSGYFDSEESKLVVAVNRKDWLPILVHEYGHLTQWVDRCKEWVDNETGLEGIDEWLNGKEVRNIKDVLSKSRDLELDNEKRSVRIIKKWNLPIDVKLYTQKANAYVCFYNYMYFSRRWCGIHNSPYKNPAIYSHMPTTFRMNYQKLSDKYKNIYEAAGL